MKDGIDDVGDFERPLTSMGYMGRGTKWLVKEGCRCPYNYGGVVPWHPHAPHAPHAYAGGAQHALPHLDA